MIAEWVIGTFEGEKAKSVRAHADAGIGYFVLREGGKGQGYTVVAAFKRATDKPLSPHLERADAKTIAKLEELQAVRNGRPQRSQ